MKLFNCMLFILNFLIIICMSAFTENFSAEKILYEIDKVQEYNHVIMETTQVITTSDGDKMTLKIASWQVDTGNKQLSIYMYPKRIKGVKILMLNNGNDIYSYPPRTRRTRHLSSHSKKQKVMGSDFTYEDLGNSKISEKYTGIVLKEEKYDSVDCYVLELKPTPKGPGYDKIIAWVGKKDFYTRKIDYFEDNNAKVFKSLYLKNIKNIAGHLTAMEMIIKNHEDSGTTYNKLTKIGYDTEISNRKFQSNRLDRK